VLFLSVRYKDDGTQVDSPYTSREEYIKVLELFNSREDVEILDVYQDKWMWDVMDYM
jgi:hypothetical protein